MSIKKVDNYRIRLNQILGINGTTYIGYNNLSKEEVVIKVIPKLQIAKKYQKNQECFKQEVKFMHKIRKNASYVVRYLNLLQTNNHFYLIQELCKGGNLKKLLMERKLTVSQGFKYMRHILKGFMQLIKKGILHGNLTPSNILFHNGLMRLADFGLNISQDIESIYSRVKNTTYLAPQVLQGKNYTDKSDIWSLGFIFYEMLYGAVPWKTGGFVKIYLERLENQPLQFPSSPEVSQQLKQLIRNCLSIDPTKRIQWKEIYSSPIFNGEFQEMESIDITLKYILGNLRKSLNESNLDLQRFFQSKKITNQTLLNQQTFQKILSSIDSSMEMSDISYLFNLFDSNQTNLIQFSSFKNALQHFQISFEFHPLRKPNKKKPDQFTQTKIKQPLLEAALLKLVHQIMLKKIYDLCDVFIHTNKDFSSIIDFGQFCKMLRKIDPKLNDEQCRTIYKKIDPNNDGQLTLQEFMKSICILTGSLYKLVDS